MKKKIFGILLTLVLAVTGFGLVGCGGGNNPAPGPGPEPAPEVSYDDDTTPVPIEDTGLAFCLSVPDIEFEEEGEEPECVAMVDAITEEVEDLVIPAYVTDGEHTYKVVEIENLLFTIDNPDDFNFTGVNELAMGVKTITIPSTVDHIDSESFASWCSDEETSEDVLFYMENLEQIILNNRTTIIEGLYDAMPNLFDKALDKIFAAKLNVSLEELEEIYNEEPTEDLLEMYEQSRKEVLEQFFAVEDDICYIGNPGNPYMMLVRAGETYYPEELGEDEELVATINEKCVVIYDFAFSNSKITSVVLPNGLVTIGRDAFSCTWLKEIILPDTVEYIDEHSFSNLDFAETLYMSEGITDINFRNCFWCCWVDKLYINNAELYDHSTYFTAVVSDGGNIYILKTVFDNNEDILTDQSGYTRLEDEEYNGRMYVVFNYAARIL